jgi:hypothetical protein
MKSNIITRAMTPLAAALLLASCMSTRITSTWKKPDAPPAKYHKIMVASVVREHMPREMVEDEFLRQMGSRGISSVPSYTVLPTEADMTDERLLKAARDAGADALLFCQFLTANDRYSYAAGGPMFGVGMYGPHAMGWYGGYGWYGPPPVVWIDRFVYVQSKLVDAASGQIVWTCTTQSENPQHLPQGIKDFASRVITALRESRLLAAKQEGRRP